MVQLSATHSRSICSNCNANAEYSFKVRNSLPNHN